MEKCGINGPTIPHQSRRKFHVRGHLPSPYYDMLIINTFVEFGDLMYSVGRIEDGIKKGRIVDIGASMREKKRFVPDEHVQVMSGEKKRSHATSEELVKSHPCSSGYA